LTVIAKNKTPAYHYILYTCIMITVKSTNRLLEQFLTFEYPGEG